MALIHKPKDVQGSLLFWGEFLITFKIIMINGGKGFRRRAGSMIRGELIEIEEIKGKLLSSFSIEMGDVIFY